jgi:hypothetical protein
MTARSFGATEAGGVSLRFMREQQEGCQGDHFERPLDGQLRSMVGQGMTKTAFHSFLMAVNWVAL